MLATVDSIQLILECLEQVEAKKHMCILQLVYSNLVGKSRLVPGLTLDDALLAYKILKIIEDSPDKEEIIFAMSLHFK